MNLKNFSEKAIRALNGYYVYALIDPRDDSVFYIGKGIENRVFNHEIEKNKNPDSEKRKIQTIRAIENAGLSVKRVIINWGLLESEAFAAEAALINFLNFTNAAQLTNIVAGHHVHEAIDAEEFERVYGAESLTEDDIKHSILVIKINKLYHRGMGEKELYDVVRGIWKASMRSIKSRNVEYVFGVYNQLIVTVYKPDEWHYVHEMVDVPRPEEITAEVFEKMKDRVYFICKDYKRMDENQKFYLNKSIAGLSVNQGAQNPISYLMPAESRKQKVYKFAEKWHKKFQDEKANYAEFVEATMGEELRKLDFEMDAGKSFIETYGEHAFDDENMIGRVEDLELLGAAIYSNWRYFNHWAYSGAEILEQKNRSWFLLALEKMKMLANS